MGSPRLAVLDQVVVETSHTFFTFASSAVPLALDALRLFFVEAIAPLAVSALGFFFHLLVDCTLGNVEGRRLTGIGGGIENRVLAGGTLEFDFRIVIRNALQAELVIWANGEVQGEEKR